MDITKLSKGDKVIAGGWLVFFISMFLKWFGVDFGIVSASVNGWHYFFTGVVPWILVTAVTVGVLLPALGQKIKVPAIVSLLLTAVATLLVIIRLLAGDHSTDRKIGLYLALIAGIVTVVGSFFNFQAAGGNVNDLKDFNKLKGQVSGGFSTLASEVKDSRPPTASAGAGTSAAPPPPPPPPHDAPPPPPPPPPPAM
ncbi:MAG: hypothetical protein JWL70_2660 [Acidimicrobiia bacterium]|nr:hypothetical protein [Acidimicrobiia bacterium]